MSSDVVIVGGGISGLSALHWLARSGVDAMLLEARSESGGVIRSVRDEVGALSELGPNSFQMKEPALEELIDDLGLGDELVEANAAARRRYIVRNGLPVAVPMSLGQALGGRLFSRTALLRLLREPFIKSRSDVGGEESIASFVERRLGREILDYGVNPFVSGVYAGRPERLSIRHTFPRLEALEREHGSLVRGSIKAGRKRAAERKSRGETKRPRAPLVSFHDGLQTLPRAIEKRWARHIRTGITAERIERSGGKWIVHTSGGSFEAPKLILAVEAYTAAELLKDIDPALSQALASVEYPPVTTVVSIYDRTFVAHPLDGFGMLVPEVEKRNILGVIFSSTLFPNRAPDGMVALTTFIGGDRQPAIARSTDDEIARIVQIEHEQLLGVSAPPASIGIHRWERAIPQYTLGYGKIVAEIERGERENAGLVLLANYRGGVSMGDRVREGRRVGGGEEVWEVGEV
jgi:oxygen-dependent protoporphyrinogen oxidase